MSRPVLSKSQARKIVLHAAGLSKRGQFGKGKEGVYKLIDHLGFVQIDTNYVVERAHHHSIAARVPGYKPEWLEQLQSDGRIFEFWTYATGYIPMHNFRFSLPGLPVRGQKTKNNARTRKGKRKTVATRRRQRKDN
ncbi:MAG: crosslink repair DNA glycosylase YcaQ family protein [Bacteroidota bacterium]